MKYENYGNIAFTSRVAQESSEVASKAEWVGTLLGVAALAGQTPAAVVGAGCTQAGEPEVVVI